MPYKIDTTIPGLLSVRLSGTIRRVEMEAFVVEHDAAVDGFNGADYRVLCDLRGLAPLSPEASAVFERAKAYSAAHRNFRGSAVLIDSALVALQHERTSTTSGVMATELITDDEAAAQRHLAAIKRGI
jgi:hypothetical protein